MTHTEYYKGFVIREAELSRACVDWKGVELCLDDPDFDYPVIELGGLTEARAIQNAKRFIDKFWNAT